MTYLELCRKLAREAEITPLSTIPSSVAAQTGQLGRVVGWVADAWKDIQRKYPDWRWLRSTWSVNTVLGDDTYAFGDCTDTRLTITPITRFSRWWPLDEEGYPNVQIYKLSDGVGAERRMTFMPWGNFRHQYKRGTQTNQAPAHYTIDPQNQWVLGPKPDGVYVLSGEYQRGVQTLVADGDVPEMHEDYHDLIWRFAIQMYAANSVAAEVYTRAEREGTKTMRALERDQRPGMVLGEPMA